MGKRDKTKIIVDGFNAEVPLTDDAMLEQLFAAGVPFGELRNVFNDIIKEKGLRLTTKERKIKTDEIMDGVTEIADAEVLLSHVAKLQENLKVTSTKAMGSLRTWAKANKIEIPKAPRVTKPRKVGFGGHYEKILANVMELREADKEIDKKAVVAFCHSAGIPEAYSTMALNVVHFAKIWSGEIKVEAEAEAES